MQAINNSNFYGADRYINGDRNPLVEVFVNIICTKFIFERLDGGIDRIDLAQDREGWRALVNTVMNL